MRTVALFCAALAVAMLAHKATKYVLTSDPDNHHGRTKAQMHSDEFNTSVKSASHDRNENSASGIDFALDHQFYEDSFYNETNYTTYWKDYMKKAIKYLEENERASMATDFKKHITATTPDALSINFFIGEALDNGTMTNSSETTFMLPSPGRNPYEECPHRGFLSKHTCDYCENTEKALDFSKRRHPRIRMNTVFYKYRHHRERYMLAWLRPLRDPHKLVCLGTHRTIEYRCNLDEDICVIYGVECEVMHDPVTGHILFSGCRLYP
jgi:hypothetical protein